MATADTTVVTTVDTTVDTTPTTEVPTGVDTTMDITTEVTGMTTGVQPTIVMDRWIADIPTDIHIDPKRPLVVPKHQLPVIPGTEAVLLHQQNQQLPHAPVQV